MVRAPVPRTMFRKLIRVPQLWPARSGTNHRRVTGVELFFDLIFVAAVAQVGTPLSMDYSLVGLLRYVFLFALIWLTWTGHTLYCTRFDNDDLIQRVSVLVQSFVVAVMAANAKESLDSTASAGFGAAYAVMRLILAGLYWRARSVQETKSLTTRFAIGYSLSALFWIASSVSPLPWRFAAWGMGLLIDLATPWFARKHSLRHPPDAAHFPERYGLFTIILLGEFVASVMHGIESQNEWSVAAASTAFVSMAMGFAIWWWYTDGAKSGNERHVRTRRDAILFHVWNYAHFPLFVGIGIAAVGLHHAISLQPGAAMEEQHGAIICGAVALLMVALIVIGASWEAPRARIIAQVGVVAVVVSLGVAGEGLPAVALVAALGICTLLQTVLAHHFKMLPIESESHHP